MRRGRRLREQRFPLDISWLPPAVQHVVETAVQPRLAGRVVASGVNRFIMDVGEVTAEPINFLYQAAFRVRHQFPIALIPQLVTVSDRAGNTAAVSLDRVFGD